MRWLLLCSRLRSSDVLLQALVRSLALPVLPMGHQQHKRAGAGDAQAIKSAGYDQGIALPHSA